MLIRQETRAFKSLCVAMDLNAESLRKEVIHPQIPLGIPCYDLVLLTDPTCPHHKCSSGIADSAHLTGGVYKTRERIHRGIADPRLLAIPASCGRVAAHNPN